MANDEVHFLLKEVADIRRQVGGRSITLDDRIKQKKSVDAELDEIQDKIKSLEETVKQLKTDLSTAQITATSTVADAAAVTTLAQELQSSTESLAAAIEIADK